MINLKRLHLYIELQSKKITIVIYLTYVFEQWLVIQLLLKRILKDANNGLLFLRE